MKSGPNTAREKRVFTMDLETLLKKGVDTLNEAQKDVLNEYLERKTKSVGLNLCLGFGKTLLSIVIGLHHIAKGPILVVMSKTLLESWKTEIEKFFGSDLKYRVYHQTVIKNLDLFELEKDILLVLTTVDVISRLYKKYDLEHDFVHKQIINEGQFNQHFINEYRRPLNPFLKGTTRILFSQRWGTLIVDEVQTYTNITSNRCKGIGAICAEHRLSTSGTIFDEPKPEHILGYYVIMNGYNFPRTLPEAKKYLAEHYRGYKEDTITRTTNTSFQKPDCNTVIISHKLCKEEEAIYSCMKDTLSDIRKKYAEFKFQGDVHETRKFSSYLLAMLTYLRQSIVCPLVPISKVMLDLCDLKCKSDLSLLLKENLDKHNLSNWLDDEESIKSSRIKEIMTILTKHNDERVVLFTSFRTTLDIIDFFITDRPTFVITSAMSAIRRKVLIENFNTSNVGVLLLTYQIGSVGLNIQSSHTVLLADLWWNALTTQQAIGRLVRQGQKSKVVNIYYFTSNTGVENAVFNKQDKKLEMLSQLEQGTLKTKMNRIKVLDIIKMIDLEDNETMIGKMARLSLSD